MKLNNPRFVLAYPLVIGLLFFGKTTERTLNIGIALAALGLLVRFWANGYVGHVKVNSRSASGATVGSLITAGPYAYVRHPLYFGSFLIGAGLCLIAGNWVVDAAALIFFLAVYGRKMREEEQLIREQAGAPYDAYRAAVPQWLPVGRRYQARHGSWSWQGIAASKEWKTVIWVTVMVLLFYVREEIFQEHEWPGRHTLKLAMWMAVAVVLMLTDGIMELRKHWQGRALA